MAFWKWSQFLKTRWILIGSLNRKRLLSIRAMGKMQEKNITLLYIFELGNIVARNMMKNSYSLKLQCICITCKTINHLLGDIVGALPHFAFWYCGSEAIPACPHPSIALRTSWKCQSQPPSVPNHRQQESSWKYPSSQVHGWNGWEWEPTQKQTLNQLPSLLCLLFSDQGFWDYRQISVSTQTPLLGESSDESQKEDTPW